MHLCKSIKDVIDNNLCISCGACVGIATEEIAQMVLDKKKGILIPCVYDKKVFYNNKLFFEVCPGKGIPIESLSDELFQDTPLANVEFGRFRCAYACHTNNNEYLKNSSSGGMMTQISSFLLAKKLIDGVTVVKFIKGNDGPRTQSYIAHSTKDLLEAQGSKYCPTSVAELIGDCIKTGGRYLFSGTPCQVGALRMYLKKKPEYENIFPFTMANFCGGYRDFRYLDGIIRNAGVKPSSISEFRFRGGGWPGSLLARNPEGQTVIQSYPNFTSDSIVNKQLRCVLCVDGTGLLADFACGDAWIDRYINENSGHGWSIVVCRSQKAENIFKEIIKTDLVVAQAVNMEDLLYSQRYNIESKIYRQKTRLKVMNFFCMKVPKFDIKLPESRTTFFNEWKILGVNVKCCVWQHIQALH